MQTDYLWEQNVINNILKYVDIRTHNFGLATNSTLNMEFTWKSLLLNLHAFSIKVLNFWTNLSDEE